MSGPATPSRPRPVRRAPTDLSFHLDPAFVEGLAAREPDWSAADRRAALERFTALPIETNHLYTTYVDLRAATLEDVRPYETVATTTVRRASRCRPTRPPSRRSRRTGSSASSWTRPRPRPASTLESLGGAHRARSGRPRSACSPMPRRSPRRPPRPADPRRAGTRARCCGSRPASGSPSRSIVRWAVGAADRAPHHAHDRGARQGRGGLAGRGARRRPPRTTARPPVAAHRHHRGRSSARTRGSRWPASRSSDRTPSRSSTGSRRIGTGAIAPLGARPARLAGSSAAASTTGSRAIAARSSRSRSCSAATSSSST